MDTTAKDELREVVDQLSDEDAAEILAFAQRLLSQSSREAALPAPVVVEPADQAAARRRVLAEGRPPLDIAALAAGGWLAGEDPNQVVAAIDQWRREGGYV